MYEAQKRGEKLNMSEDEIAIYDALEVQSLAQARYGANQ